MRTEEKVKVSTVLDFVTNLKLKKLAEMDYRSKSKMIEVLIKDFIKKYETENGEILTTHEKY